MPVRSLLRTSALLGLTLLGLAATVAACSGVGQSSTAAAVAPGATNPATGATGSAAPSVDWVDLLSPEPSPAATPDPSQGLTPAATPAATPRPTDPTSVAISTTKASSLLSQVDHLLNELNGELSNADAAANNPGE
ncbi:MAG: hypothetical protein ACHQXL_09720 [Candidatus Limnocylindrales bacterium]